MPPAHPHHTSSRAASGLLAEPRVQCVAEAGFSPATLQRTMRIRFYVDPATGELHIYDHGVTEDEVADVLDSPTEDRPSREGSRVAIGRTGAGRYLRVIYVPDPEPRSMFVITAYELRGSPLAAYRRRRRRKGIR